MKQNLLRWAFFALMLFWTAGNWVSGQLTSVASSGLPNIGRGEIKLVDFTGDGILDALVVGQTSAYTTIPTSTTGGTIALYQGNGNCTFTDVTSTWLPTSAVPATATVGCGNVAVADYNGDGLLDFCYTGYSSAGKIFRLLKNTGSSFTDVTNTTTFSAVPTGIYNGSIEWGDIDNDGDLDLMLCGRIYSALAYPTSSSYRTNSFQIYKNNGNGTFTQSVSNTTLGVCFGQALFVDIDRDNDLDVMYSGGGNVGGYMINDGTGTFTTTSAWTTRASNMAIGDFNKDGNYDFVQSYIDVSTAFVLQFRLITNTSTSVNGVTTIALSGIDKGSNLSDVLGVTGSAATSTNGMVSCIDYDNDGDLDYTIQGLLSTTATTELWLNNGATGTVSFTNSGVSLKGLTYGGAVWGDLDNDGDADLINFGYTENSTTATTPSTSVYLNGTAASNTAPEAPVLLTPSVAGQAVTLKWNSPKDDHTPRKSLSYNIRIGKTTGASDVMNAISYSGAVKGAYLDTVLTLNTSLTQGTYYYSVQAVDNSYKHGTWATEGTFVIVPDNGDAPSTQASFYSATFSTTQGTTSASQTTVNLGWTNGSGYKTIIFIKQGSDPNDQAAPVSNTSYTYNKVIRSGTQIGSTGWYCVYNSWSTPLAASQTFSVSGLDANTDYQVAVLSYNSTYDKTTIGYNTTMVSSSTIVVNSGNYPVPTTMVSSMSVVTNTTGTSVGMKVTLGVYTDYATVVFVKQGSNATEVVPVQSYSSYVGSLTFGSGTQVLDASGNASGWYCMQNLTDVYASSGAFNNLSTYTGLTANTNYQVQACTYNGTSGHEIYSTPKGVVLSTAQTPTSQATDLAVNAITKTTADLLWTSGNGAGRVVMISSSSTVQLPTLTNGVTYLVGSTTLNAWDVVYNGSANSCSLSSLVPGGTTYRVIVIEYNGSEGFEKYLASTSEVSFSTINETPTVEFTSPLSSVSATSSVSVYLKALDNDGNITTVDIYNETVKLGTAVDLGGGVFNFVWNSPSFGNITLTAKATDNGGAVGQATTVLSLLLSTPTLAVTNVAATNTLGTSTGLSWVDGDGNNRVIFVKKGSQTDAPALSQYVSYPPSSIVDGWVSVYSGGSNSVTISGLDKNTLYTVFVFESNNYSGSSTYISGVKTEFTTLVNFAPVVSVSGPVSSGTYFDTKPIAITINATDADGTISNVKLLATVGAKTITLKDGVVATSAGVYEYSWTGAPVGDVVLSVEATDNDGVVSTSTLPSITVSKNELPTVAVTAPVASTVTETGDAITINASASDVDGTVAQVEFFANSTSLGTVSGAPYTIQFTPSVAGTYTLSAVATDNNSGTQTTSVDVVVLTKAVAPTTSGSLSASTTSSNEATITFTNGNGAKRLVFVHEGTTPYVSASGIVAPSLTSKVSYVAASVVDGWLCVASGTPTSPLSLNSLNANTEYNVAVYEYNGTEGFERYASAVSYTFVTPKRTQSLTGVSSTITKTYGDAAFTVTASSDLIPSLPVSYTIVAGGGDASVASVNETSVSINKAGICYIKATQAGNDTIASAEFSAELVVAKAIPTTAWNTPAAITYGDKLTSTQLNATVTGNGVATYTPAANTILNAGINTLVVEFAESTNYLAASTSVDIEVAKAVPATHWATPSAITYGTKLTNTELNASVDGNGTATYTPGFNSIPNAGTNVLLVEFNESANYLAASATVSLVVDKAIPSYSWTAPSAIAYGTLLSATQLNASVDGNGKATYSPDFGSLLTVGSHTLNVSFDESENYLASSTSLTLDVFKGTPIITWEPDPIEKNTALTSADLNAVASLTTSSAVYTSATGSIISLGDVLPSGANEITVSFEADANCEAVSKTVFLVVSEKMLTQINWTLPSAITYGTALSSSQLNATLVVKSTQAVITGAVLKYVPALGSVLDAGTQKLQVSYDGSNDYEAVTKTITIEVDKALLTATAQANTKVYANANPSFGVVYTGFVNGETESVIDTKATSTSVATTTSNVGSYAITVNGASDNNYNFVYVPATLTVTPAALTVTANNQSKSYGATFIPVVTEFTSNGLKNSDGVSSVSLTSAGTVASAVVSSYALTPSAASGSGLSNYSITYIAGSLTVSPAALTITANNESKTYGASLTLAGTEFSSNGLKNSDAVSSVTLTSAGTAASTVIGSYSITPSAAVGTGLSNYTISYTAGSLTVSPAALSVTASNLSKTYGATQTYAGSEFAANGLKNSDAVSSVTLTSAGTAATTSIGSYSITPSAALGLGLSNYTISYTAGSLTVSPATLSVTASNLSKTYGATQTYAGTEFATSGLKNTDAVSSVTLISAGSAATTSAGSYAINASAAVGTGLSNYTISYTDGTLTVSPAALTVSASNQTKTYGATLTLAASGFTASGLKNSDVVSSVTLASSGTTASTVVGSYAITPSEAVGTGLSNYTISYTAGSLTVSAAALTVTASNQTKTYGATQTFVGTEFTTSGLKNSDAVSSATLTSTGSAATSAATTYAITPSAAGGSGLSNYTITYANGTLTVSPAALIVTASNQTKTYGATLTVTGSGVTATGLKNTDAVSSVTLISTGSAATAAVNSYVLTPSAAVGTGLSNYTISYTAGSLTVSPAALTVSASNQTKTYGATLTITGLGAAATGLKNSDAVSSVTLTSTGTAATAAVNSYAITPSAAVGSGLSNYTISYTAGTLTVSPAALTVTANNGSKVYGSALSLAGTEVVATGLKNNDAVSSATLASAGTATTATVGSYAVTPSAAVGTGLSNYTISYTAGSLTVSPAALTVTANNESKVYGSALTLAGTEIVAAGLKNSDAVASATLASAGTATTATVGSYAVTPSAAVGTGLSNYTISYTAGTLTVSPAALTVTANNESKVYGSALSLAGTEVVATGLKNSDAVASATLASAGTATTAIAGSYAINASAAVGTGLSNYTISYTDGTLTVSPAALTVCANNQSKVYGSALSLAGTEVVATGLKNSDAVSSATLTSAGTATTATVGSYAVTPSAAVGTGLSNYTILYTAGTLTVSPAALSISANNESKVYGSALSLAGTEFTATGLKNSDAVSSVTLASTGSAATAAVSNYTITLSDAVGTGLSNYTISYTDGSLTVTKASLKAIATSVSKVYGAALPTYAVSYTGFANNESESVITTKATASSDAKVSSKVGSYAISVSGASASNYSFVYVPATLTITKATLTIAANDTTVQKDKTLPVFTYTVIGLVNDDTEASAFTGTPELTADVTSAKVGDAVGIIVAVGTLSSDNYEFNLVSGTLTIIKNVKVSTANAVDVAVYPNPAVSGNVSVKLASASKGTVSVISLGGAIIANKVIDSQLIDINVDALPVGTYYIRINTENGSVVKTLIKQ